MIALARTLPTALAAALLMPLAACSEGGGTSTAAEGEPSAGLTVSNARVVLAPVAGNPAAVYFDLSYTGAPGVSLTGVEVAGAGMTMMHDYAEEAGKMMMVMTDEVPLSEGTPVSFAPGGLHVMVMQPSEALAPGSTAKITLTLSNGTTATVEAPVRAAGDER
ncbi:copper chaperone PCu(A)C [Erythrobacter sp. NE805]|uniref:copper chaperone PCu(A)C n=1 Tax=Erythrobacter sp. NE805 TaxID=3389875 RepID=UPI00396B45B3